MNDEYYYTIITTILKDIKNSAINIYIANFDQLRDFINYLENKGINYEKFITLIEKFIDYLENKGINYEKFITLIENINIKLEHIILLKSHFKFIVTPLYNTYKEYVNNRLAFQLGSLTLGGSSKKLTKAIVKINNITYNVYAGPRGGRYYKKTNRFIRI